MECLGSTRNKVAQTDIRPCERSARVEFMAECGPAQAPPPGLARGIRSFIVLSVKLHFREDQKPTPKRQTVLQTQLSTPRRFPRTRISDIMAVKPIVGVRSALPDRRGSRQWLPGRGEEMIGDCGSWGFGLTGLGS